MENAKESTNEIIIRRETEEDYLKTEEMTMRAFWNLHGPGCDEHLLVHKLRKDACYRPELSRVAVMGDRIIGTIMYAEAKVVTEEGNFAVLTFGPLCVELGYQDSGIGGKLLEETLFLARKSGYPAIIIFGEPGYYPKHGFRTCDQYGITTPDGKNLDAFMALELVPNGLKDKEGKFYESPVYSDLTKEETDKYSNLFPPIRKMKFPGQWEYEDATQEKDGYTLVSAVLHKKKFTEIFEEYLYELAMNGKWLEEALKSDQYFLSEEIGQYFAVPEKKPYVILSKDQVIGIVVFSVPQAEDEQDGCDYYVEELYLVPAYRRKGVASDIISRYWRQAKGTCGLCVFCKNRGAVRFWEKMIADHGRKFGRSEVSGDMWMYCIFS